MRAHLRVIKGENWKIGGKNDVPFNKLNAQTVFYVENSVKAIICLNSTTKKEKCGKNAFMRDFFFAFFHLA